MIFSWKEFDREFKEKEINEQMIKLLNDKMISSVNQNKSCSDFCWIQDFQLFLF
jgi:hypothetical protein